MRLLLDTRLLLWSAQSDIESAGKRSALAASLIDDETNTLLYSVASPWEIAIKHGLGRDTFKADPCVLRRSLRENGYEELPILGEHALAIAALPPLHKDPFDRMLVAQATADGVTLVTSETRSSPPIHGPSGASKGVGATARAARLDSAATASS